MINKITVVDSCNLTNDETYLRSNFEYKRNQLTRDGSTLVVRPEKHIYQFKTQLKPAKTGLLLVGLGGNNGSTVVGATIANREGMTWHARRTKKADYLGSITQSTTVHLGYDGSKQVYVPFNSLLPMVHPNNLVIDGWDINNANLYDAMLRAKVFEHELIEKLRPQMEHIVPKPSIYYSDFIASNQGDRVNNVIAGDSKQEHLQKIRKDIRDFKDKHKLDTVIVLWTANTERFTSVEPHLNSTAEQLLQSIQENAEEISPSNIFAVAAILEGAHYINGSPQNTLTPGVIELAQQRGVFIGGDDFKSGQTKLKSALVEFLVSSGIKPESIVSYNHLGNNDGKNLSEAKQFRSKEISKSSVVDDMVDANPILYKPGEKPDHVIVIKYVPFVGDSKRAMDEYISSIFMGGHQTLAIHNTCEDSLLAAPLILDLAILTELFTRIQYSNEGTEGVFKNFHSVLSLLSLLLKAPVVPPNTPVGNAFMKQFVSITKLMTICAGLHSDADIQLEFFTEIKENMGDTEKEKLLTDWDQVCLMCDQGSEVKFMTKSEFLNTADGVAYQLSSSGLEGSMIVNEPTETLPFRVNTLKIPVAYESTDKDKLPSGCQVIDLHLAFARVDKCFDSVRDLRKKASSVGSNKLQPHPDGSTIPGDLIYDVPDATVRGFLHLTDHESITHVEAKGQERLDMGRATVYGQWALSSNFGKFTESASSVVSNRGVDRPPLLQYGPAARSQTNCPTKQETESPT
uniref:Inositol-3-phosphate synthase n=1 Tax=Ditylenchus dipsaci TaxID=166011 RepID=A0A915ESH6_9BILA